MLVHPRFDPIAFKVFGFPVHWYGLTYLVAFGLFLWLASLRVRQPWYAQQGWKRTDIEDLHAIRTSLMPEGQLKAMSDQQIRDLFAYLRSTQPLADRN